MNPSNPFGSPQGFQATSNTNASLFQPFGQQSPNRLPQNVGGFQSSAFGLPTASKLPGNTMFGQGPSFGQQTSQTSSLPSHTPAFGQLTVGGSNSGFASTFGGSSQTSAFGQTPAFGQQQTAFGQDSSFGQLSSGFGQKLPSFGQQAPGFGNAQSTSGATTSLGQPQQIGFGQSVFGKPATTTVAGSIFGATPTQSRGFGSEFTFKPASEVLFKPIYSGSPEPVHSQTMSLSSLPFSSATEKTSSSTTSSSTITGFSGAKSGSLGFSFSPSVPVQNNPLTTASNSGPTSALQFTFSQPGAPSTSNTNAPVTQPKTPSTFSFSSKTFQPQTAPLFGGTGIVQPSAFSDNKSKVESTSDDKTTQEGDANIFSQFRKGVKRKEEPTTSASHAIPEAVQEEEETTERSTPRQPQKRALMRTRPPAGLFSRALSGLRKASTPPIRKEAKEPLQQKQQLKELKSEHPQVQHERITAGAQTQNTEVLEKAEESDSLHLQELMAETKTPKRTARRSESSDSLSGTSPTDCTVIQCRNMPPALNKRDIIVKHFSRFGKVCKVFCRPARKTAIVHFDNHASAAKAKKRGKHLHQHELLLLWQKKKQSPGDKTGRPVARKKEDESKIQDDSKIKVSSPLIRPLPGSNFSHSSPVKKTPICKSLQFESELQKENVTMTPSSECLAPLIGIVAETSEDKYRLLEQRDKILRQSRPKSTDIDLSKVFVGTCPDMCPEKERYMRETRQQLSVYETLPNTEMVDHSAAVKEYSRSSADQEEPLPHELRPLPVLSMTMDYLVTQIMDQGHENLRDWYDFVWNRTRGIRKDITQQRLCCPETVSLIEKCTRFHLHCAHHLCEEPMSVFDVKINNENLTKCLQSLKEMYEDLKGRQIYCPREAEFRQYSVLLKLNDGDILREVQQFREEVRNSPEVNFAVQAFAALNSNNFVRFFKLVNTASYLASCLLHRYFNQVRGKALKTLNIAHTVGPRSTAFPVEDIARMLMFCSAKEATVFIQQYGLNVNEGAVELNRVFYQEPELIYQKKSAIIQAKKTALTGEIVNGGPLPNPPQHYPVCTFDSQNKYRGENLAADPFKVIAPKVEAKALPNIQLQTQVLPVKHPDVPSVLGLRSSVPEKTETSDSSSSVLHAESQQPILQPPPVKAPSPEPEPQPVFSDEDIMAEVDSLIDEMVEAAAREVAADGASYVTAALAETSLQAESVLNEVLGEMLREMSSTEIHVEQERLAEEKRKIEEARRKEEHEAFLVKFKLSLYTEIMREVLEETMTETATTVLQEALDERARYIAKCSQEVCTDIIEETLKADIAVLVEEILAAELQRAHKYIKRWRDVVAVRRQLKRQMRGFPAAPCFVDPRFKLKALAPSAPAQQSLEDLTRGTVDLGNGGRLSLSSTRVLKMRCSAIHQMRVQYYFQQLLEELVWAPLDLPALVVENLHDPPDRIFWKALVLLPSDHESVASLADRILSDWLEVKLAGSQGSKFMEEQQDGTLQTLYFSNTVMENGPRTHKIHVSVKVSRGPLTEDGLSKVEEGCELQGAGALIMLLPALPIPEPQRYERDVPLLSALLQLKQLQQASTWHCPLPLVILVPGPERHICNTQKLEEELKLPMLVKDGLISEYTFLFIPETTNDLQGSKQLSYAMRWLVPRAPPPVPLTCQTLAQLVEAGLSREFSRRVSDDRQERLAAGLSPQDPAAVVQLYNAVIGHIADKVSSEELSKISWPPGEFCMPETGELVPHLSWNAGPHLAWLRKAVLNLQLPQWTQLSTTDTWSELYSGIYGYADQILATRGSQPLFMSRLENLLERARFNANRRRTSLSERSSYFLGDTPHAISSAYSQIPWVEMLVICIEHKLKDWHLPGPPTCEDAITEDGEILVYYLDGSLKGFHPPEEWNEAVRMTHREKQRDHKGTSSAACATPDSLSIRQKLFSSVLEPAEAREAPLDISHTATALEALTHKVFRTLEEEKAESLRSTQQLQRWLEGGDCLEQWPASLLLPSSILLSMPTLLKHGPSDKAFTKEAHRLEPLKKDKRSQRSRLSLTERLRELQQQIGASHEEELACKLKLSAMMSIVED
ncbi:germinal-center associated nuclear protein [Corythoichthys intestinalis]|uniref:germinal-center associated nuclear protein n=1 Tax=Corythoichthys intestinalis TaxID=161448 RepID=UPI0025A554FF|nr:germinal-center associated nuclear protein [Corythoichthys intestinalis]